MTSANTDIIRRHDTYANLTGGANPLRQGQWGWATDTNQFVARMKDGSGYKVITSDVGQFTLSGAQSATGEKTFLAGITVSGDLNAVIDHTTLTNIGTYPHASIDSHITSAGVHFTEASIDHTNITNKGTYPHASIDAHITSGDVHFQLTAGANINLSQVGDTITISGTAEGSDGDVSGPGASTDNAIVRFNGTGGKTLQNSGITIDDNNNITLTSAGYIYFNNVDTYIYSPVVGRIHTQAIWNFTSAISTEMSATEITLKSSGVQASPSSADYDDGWHYGPIHTYTSPSPCTMWRLHLKDDSVYHIVAHVVAQNTSGDDRASYMMASTWYRESGGIATQIGTTSYPHSASSEPLWSAVTQGGGADVVFVNGLPGASGDTVKWKGYIQWMRWIL